MALPQVVLQSVLRRLGGAVLETRVRTDRPTGARSCRVVVRFLDPVDAWMFRLAAVDVGGEVEDGPVRVAGGGVVDDARVVAVWLGEDVVVPWSSDVQIPAV